MSVSLLHYHHNNNSLGQVWCVIKCEVIVIVMVCSKVGPQTTDTHSGQLYYI
jgi:hypothetical protein